MAETEHPRVMVNRLAKARRIADKLRESDNLDAVTVGDMSEEQWMIVADLCGYDHISPGCRVLVVNELAQPRWSNPTNPFDGING